MDVNGAIAEAQDIIRDDSITAAWLLERANMCLYDVAGIFLIPGLATDATVNALTTANNVPMPTVYHHNLYAATTATHPNGLRLAPNLKDILVFKDHEAVGPVETIAVDHRTLHYRPVPEATEAIKLFFYQKPKEVVAGSPIPSWIPLHLQARLLVNYLAHEAYIKIEDGMDEKTPNTIKYLNRYNQGLAMLQQFYPRASRPKYEINRKVAWF